MTRRYRITIYNQHAMCGIHADGRTRREAFERALTRAGEPFLRYGGGKMTMLRCLFFNNVMAPRNRYARNVSVSSPIGCCVSMRRTD